MTRVNIANVNSAHGSWLHSLNFYKTELSILRVVLTEIAGKNTSAGIRKEIEHFENQFRVQSVNIDRLAYDIHTNIHKISEEAQAAHAGYIESALLTQHNALGAAYGQLEKVLTALVQDFRKFAGTSM